MRLILLFTCFISLSNLLLAQTNIGIKTVTVGANKEIDDALIEQLAQSILSSTSDVEKDSLNEVLKAQLNYELNKEGAFTYGFNKVKSITILTPPDSAFRIFNWNLPYNNGTYAYEGIILKPNSKIYSLKEYDGELSSEELSTITTTDTNWVGGQYYDLIQKQGRFQKYYTLLTWDGNDLLTNKKHIEVLWFDGTGNPKFGAPIFVDNRNKLSRVFYEFGGQNSMRLLYSENIDRIILDHLSPPNRTLEGIYEYYGADLSYDGYDWENGTWVLKSDIDKNVTDIKDKNAPFSKRKKISEKDFIDKKSEKENKSFTQPIKE